MFELSSGVASAAACAPFPPRLAGSTLIALPVIAFFLIVQGRMVAGLTSGAVKG